MSHPRTASLILGLIALCGPALAQPGCPIADDLAQGIELFQTEPDVRARVWMEDGLFHEERTDASGAQPSTRETTRTHYLLPPTETSGQRRAAETELTPEDADTLPDAGALSAPMSVSIPGRGTGHGELRLTFLDYGTVQLGPCQYDTWIVRMEQAVRGETHTFELTYAPNLGVLLGGSSPANTLLYDRISMTDVDISP